MKNLYTLILVVSGFAAIGQRVLQPPPPVRTWQSIMDGCLRNIQSGDTAGVGFAVYDIASVWASAGFVEQANQLLTRFWNYHLTDLDEFRNIHDGFRVLWALSGKLPNSIPFRLYEVDKIVQQNWDGLFNYFPGTVAVYPDSVRSRSWRELSGDAVAAKATLLSFDVHKPHHRAARPDRVEAVLAFSQYLASLPPGYDQLYSGIAAVVAASLQQDDNAKKIIRDLGTGYLRLPQIFTLVNLMKDTATARLLLSGVLAPIWSITDSSCSADLQKVEALLARRASGGPSLVFGQLTLRALLQRLTDSALSIKDLEYDKSVSVSRWLGYPPAQPNQIAAAEKRLGVDLPEEYKTFLRETNGFKAVSNVGVSFLPADSIGLLRDLDSQLADLWGTPMGSSRADSARAAGFRRAILIGGFNEEQQFLLVPPAAGEDNQWHYWFFASWTPGITAYPSLRFYLEHELQFFMDK